MLKSGSCLLLGVVVSLTSVSAARAYSTTACTPTQQSAIDTAFTWASWLAGDAVEAIGFYSDDRNYTWWFGAPDPIRRETLKTKFRVIRDTFMSPQVQYYCLAQCSGTLIATTFKGIRYLTHLCPRFFTLPLTGRDSQTGTIIHELSHFYDVANTVDSATNPDAAHGMAVNNPSATLTSAYNFEYYAEDIRENPITVMTVARLDGSGGNNDVIAYSSALGLRVRYNNDGRWAPLLYPAGVTHVAAGNLDNYGLDDIVVATTSIGIRYMTNGSALWNVIPKPADQPVRHMVLGDVDGDGRKDVIAQFAGWGVGITTNLGASWKKIHMDYPISHIAVGRLGHVNSWDTSPDSRDDVVLAFDGWGIGILHNNGGDTDWVGPIYPSYQVNGLVVGDVDGNGLDDVVANFGDAGLLVRSSESGQWTSIHPQYPIGTIALADMDEDGAKEVIAYFDQWGLGVYDPATLWRNLHQPWTIPLIVAGSVDTSPGEDILVRFVGWGVGVSTGYDGFNRIAL